MYKSLTDSTRKVTIRGTLSTKKGDEGIVGRSEYPYTSVDWQGEAWYRVMGEAGTRIPEDPFTMAQLRVDKYCRTNCPGYLPSGSHPKTPGELVDNVEVCYNCNNEICFYRSRNILRNITNNVVKIRHCGDYFVYYLTRPFSHPLRYCTE